MGRPQMKFNIYNTDFETEVKLSPEQLELITKHLGLIKQIQLKMWDHCLITRFHEIEIYLIKDYEDGEYYLNYPRGHEGRLE